MWTHSPFILDDDFYQLGTECLTRHLLLTEAKLVDPEQAEELPKSMGKE